MTLRKISLLILTCTVGLASHTFLNSSSRLIAACSEGTNDAKDVSACTKLIDAFDQTDMTILAQLHLLRAQKYVRLDQDEIALPDLNRAIELADNYPDFYTQRGIVYTKLGDYETALLDYEASLQLYPNSLCALHWRADTFLRSQRYQEALTGFEAALVVSPKYRPSLTERSLSLIQLNRLEDAIQATTDILNISSEDLWTLRQRANLHAKTEQFELALADVELYIQIEPNRSNVHTMRAYYLAKLGETDAAVAAFDQVIKSNPESSQPFITLIDIWLDVKNYEQMAIDAQRAYDLFPLDDTILGSLFFTYSRSGQDALADVYLSIWAQQDPSFSTTLQILENSFGQNHPMASPETQLPFFKGFIYALVLEKAELAKTSFEKYFEAGGPDSVRNFQFFLEQIGLRRRNATGIYDASTSSALSEYIKQAEKCLGEWRKSTAL